MKAAVSASCLQKKVLRTCLLETHKTYPYVWVSQQLGAPNHSATQELAKTVRFFWGTLGEISSMFCILRAHEKTIHAVARLEDSLYGPKEVRLDLAIPEVA